MNLLVIFPGRYQPFHKGHKSVYDWLSKQFGEDSVYIATSDVVAPVTSPFKYEDKLKMATKLGIPASRFVKVKNPYQAQEIVSKVPDPENTALIFAVSEKDMGDSPRFKFGKKKDGSPSYMQPFPGNIKDMESMSKHAYVIVVPTVDFRVNGVDANSATQIRKSYIDSNDIDRAAILSDLYGNVDPEIKHIFDRDLLPAEIANEFTYLSKNNTGSLMTEQRIRMSKILKGMLVAESIAARSYIPYTENLVEDYIDEKTGK